jgi:thymidylate synthase
MISHARQLARDHSDLDRQQVRGSEADENYRFLLASVLLDGGVLMTRNAETVSSLTTLPVKFTRTPLVTRRKTAWKMALREMEWFMSGNSKCPEVLLPWWEKQLDRAGKYLFGYSDQYRWSSFYKYDGYLEKGEVGCFDQIAFLLANLRNHPHSRRLILTAWNPGEMARICEVNSNQNTPTTCHSTMIQFFVRQGLLHAKHYQRSADLLLGVPHNWIQHWALLMYLARHTGLGVGSMRWDFGDAHIYTDPSHIQAVEELFEAVGHPECKAELVYTFSGALDHSGTPLFKAADFLMEGDVPAPITTIKPTLFE